MKGNYETNHVVNPRCSQVQESNNTLVCSWVWAHLNHSLHHSMDIPICHHGQAISTIVFIFALNLLQLSHCQMTLSVLEIGNPRI